MSSLFHKKEKKSETVKADTTSLDGRETTFTNASIRWPSSLPSKDTMADAGYYFTPTEKYSDCCTCYRCGIKMYNWLPDDVPRVEHKKLSPSCKEAKTWTDVSDADLEKHNPNRAEQTESQRKMRTKIADKAKRLTGGFHRRASEADQNQPLPALSKESLDTPSKAQEADRELNDEEKLASIRRQREFAEKALDGLEKLSSFYQSGTPEQKLAEQNIVLQSAELERLRSEESRLSASMGALSFGNGWNTMSRAEPSVHEDAESPVTRGRSGSKGRALPKLPSQMAREEPRVPARVNTATAPANDDVVYKILSKTESSNEWTEYHTDDGTPYYYNTLTKETVWTIPSAPAAPKNHSFMFPVSSN